MIPKKLPKLDSVEKQKTQKESTQSKKKSNEKPVSELPKNLSTKLPKSEYDNNGRPILNIDNLDDTDLSNQIGRLL